MVDSDGSSPRQGGEAVTLGDEVLELRFARGWSQRELARRSMVRHALICELERNKKRDTTGQAIRRLAITLKTSADYLLGMYDGL
jgi:transcriptional regulator with XRE-family HTH domain